VQKGSDFEREGGVAAVACTRGQEGVKGRVHISNAVFDAHSGSRFFFFSHLHIVSGGLHPKEGGTEGPHTLCVASSGAMYSFGTALISQSLFPLILPVGTCHKGLLANLADKTGAFGQPWDELFPCAFLLPHHSRIPTHIFLTVFHLSYRIGSPPKNSCRVPPLSPYACWPPQNYAVEPGRMVSVVSAHIHAAACGEDGRLWAWGCGSNDGRCGVERFLNMAGEGKPPRIDAMKCYMMGPHRVGCARAAYWPHGPSLDGERTLALLFRCATAPHESHRDLIFCETFINDVRFIRNKGTGGCKRSQPHGLHWGGGRLNSGLCKHRIGLSDVSSAVLWPFDAPCGA
jgi:hypothetical protein